jgi:asparagine synthase (glutamine-hydrolysing)
VGRKPPDILEYTAIRREALDRMHLSTLAAERDLDFAYRPRADGFAARLWVMRRIDRGTYNKGTLAGWGIEMRDPAADRRLVEFCLGVPMEEYLSDGVPRALAKRALADRLPEEVLSERRKGLQAVDWHDGATASRAEIRAMIGAIASSRSVARLLDVERLQTLADDWPTSGWERDGIFQSYRLALLRGVSAGHFLKKASGAN